MNHTDRRRAIQAIAQQARDLLGPGTEGIDAMLHAINAPPAPPEHPTPRPPGPPTSHPDPTPTAATDPTRARLQLEAFDLHITDADNALRNALNIVGQEIRRITPKQPPPTQRERHWCKSCTRTTGNDGQPYHNGIDPDRYRDYCTKCGRWKAEHGHIPPIGIVEHWRHGLDRLNTKIITAAYQAEDRPIPDTLLDKQHP